MLSRFYLIPDRYGQTDRRTDRFAISISRVSVLMRVKKVNSKPFLTPRLATPEDIAIKTGELTQVLDTSTEISVPDKKTLTSDLISDSDKTHTRVVFPDRNALH